MKRERKIGKVFIYWGVSRWAVGLGVRIDRWSFSADFGPFWIGAEW